MAAGDLSDGLVTEIRVRLGEPTANVWLDAEVFHYLNEAQLVVAGIEALDAALWPLSEIENGTWVAGTSAYALPALFLRERYVTVGGQMARRVPVLGLDALRSDTFFEPSLAVPFYAIIDGKLQFYTGGADPAVLEWKLYYMKRPGVAQITTSADPMVPKLLHDALADYAVSRCWEQALQFEQAQAARAQFTQKIEALKRRYGTGAPSDMPAGDPALRQGG